MAAKNGSLPSIPRERWLDRALKRWWSLSLFAAFDLSLMAAVIALTIVSSRRQGFVTVPESTVSSDDKTQAPGSSPSGSWNVGIVWTALPSVVFQIFSAYWAWIAGTLAIRQPYVELRKKGGSPAKKSVLLDYRTTFVVWRWFKAFSLGHGTVGAALLLALALQFVVSPLSARLFATQLVVVSTEIPVSFYSKFSQTGIQGENRDWRSVIQTVAATLIHHGENPSWTDNEFAFRPFTPAG